MVIYPKRRYLTKAFFWFVVNQRGLIEHVGEITVLINHDPSLKLSSKNIPWALYLSNSLAITHSHLNPSSTPNPPSKFKAKHTSKLSEVFAELLQTVFHESQAMSYFCLHAISSLNTNPGPISNPNIPPTPTFLLQPIFYLPCICSCSPIPLWLPILCIYLHIV